MKQNLGKVLLLLLGLQLSLLAEAWEWKVLSAPESLYVGESGVIRYECRFSTNAADYTIAFKPQSTDSYTLNVLTQSDKIINDKRVQTFDVLISPKREGDVMLALDALMRHTTFASIENASIGRDNVKKYDFNDVKAFLPKITFKAKANSASLSGNVTLEAKVDKTDVSAHEPVHLTVILRGEGNLDRYAPMGLRLNGVNVFAEKPVSELTLSAGGYTGEIRQEFALVSNHPYVIPSFNLQLFDTQSQSMKTLKTAPIKIQIQEGYTASNLLDAPDMRDTAQLKQYAFYGGLMGLGALICYGIRLLWRFRPKRSGKSFWEGAASEKELSIRLALKDATAYAQIIHGLDTGNMSLHEAKKQLNQHKKGQS